MSEENVEIMRGMLDRAHEDPGALFEILAEDVEWETGGLGAPDLPTCHGPDGVRDFFRRWTGAFEEWGWETEDLIDAGDSVITQTRQWGRGKGSGVEVDARFWQIWTFRNGKVVHSTYRQDRGEALEAAGLSE